MTRTLIENSIVFKNDTFIHDHVIVIEDEKITSVVPQAGLIQYDSDSRVDRKSVV